MTLRGRLTEFDLWFSLPVRLGGEPLKTKNITHVWETEIF